MGIQMKGFRFAVLAVTAALMFTRGAMADQLTGSLAIVGIDDVTFNSKSVAFTNGGLTLELGWGGSLPAVSGPVALNGFTFAHPNGVELFDFVGSGSPVTFTIEGGITEAIVNGILTITGSGLLREAGYSSNTGNFDLSISRSGQSDAFEITTVAAPEPSSLMLLGIGLLGLALVLYRKAKSTNIAVQK